MKITVSEIKEEGIELDLSEALASDSVLRPAGPVDVHLRIERHGSEVSVHGEIHGRVILQCCRCLKDFQREHSLGVDLHYHPSEEIEVEEVYEIPAEEADIGFYRDDELDITQLLREQMILSLPMKPLCTEACKGLCPVCGADLNTEACGCRREAFESGLSGLKKLFSGKKEH